MTEIYLIRHAQSLGNELGRYVGQTDVDLSNLGKMQAEKLKDYLKAFRIDTIYSSSLTRAVNTIKPYADECGLRINKNDNLMEIFAGDWENCAFEELETNYPVEYGEVWMHNVGLAKCPGGESMADLQKRVFNEMKQIAEASCGKTIAVVSHGAAIRSFMCRAYGYELSQMKDIDWVSNASVTRIFYDNGNFNFDCISYDGFLGDLRSTLPKNV